MKILLHDYAGHPFQVELSRAMASRGHEVRHLYSASTLTPRGQLNPMADDPKTFSISGISLGRTIAKYNFLDRFRLESQYSNLLVEECEKFAPDVVITANTPSLVLNGLVKWTAKTSTKLVFWVQDLYGLAAYRILSEKLPVVGHLAGSYFIHLDKKAAKASHAVVVISDDFAPHLKRYGADPSRIHVISNWAPLDALPVGQKDNPWSRSQGLSPEPVRFLYSGTLSIRHNPEMLVQLAVKLQEWGNGELVVISEGPGIEYVRKRVDELKLKNVRCFPFQPFGQMSEVFASSDVLVSVLEREAGVFCVPSKVLSYMCASRAQLVGIPLENLAAKLVEKNGMGMVSDPDDVNQFLQNAETLYRNPSQREECGRAARAFAEANFELEGICDRFLSVVGATPVQNHENRTAAVPAAN